MSRKKAAKSLKTKVSRQQPKNSALAVIESLEKSYKEAPLKLATQYRKDIASLKQQETKLKSALKKMQAQKKSAKKKQLSLTKSKSTQASKKQLAAAKQANVILSKTSNEMIAQMDLIKKHIKMLSAKQAKFAALSKQLLKLEKEWEKKARLKAKTSKKSRKKTARRISISLTPEPLLAPEVLPVNASSPLQDVSTEMNS